MLLEDIFLTLQFDLSSSFVSANTSPDQTGSSSVNEDLSLARIVAPEDALRSEWRLPPNCGVAKRPAAMYSSYFHLGGTRLALLPGMFLGARMVTF